MSTPVLAPELVAAPAGRLAALRRRPVLLAVGGLAVLAIAIVAGIALGTVAVSPADTIAILAHELLAWPVAQAWPATAETIVMELRLPRVLTALIVGFGLAVAGTTFQGLLRNPLADPYVLGTASGAALGAAIGVVLPVQIAVVGLGLVNLLAFGGALLAVAIVLRLAGGGGRATLTTLLLTGYAVGSLLAAGLALAMYLSGLPPAADLLLPARQLLPVGLAEPRDRAADHRRSAAGSSSPVPVRSTRCSSATTPRATSDSTSVASVRSSSGSRRS